MIKINKSINPPDILMKNSGEWTKNLKDAIDKYGGYKKIPKDEKDKLLRFYRHREIQKKLEEASCKKCSFCECVPSEGGNLEVEHFAPKSIYPELAFEWDNLLPACSKCNQSKTNHDTIKKPILNPAVDNVEECLDFNYINIIAKEGTSLYNKACLTIDICGLNTIRLWKPRSEILITLSAYEKNLKDFLEEFKEASTERIKKNKIRRLRESVEIIESLSDRREKYSLFSKKFLEKSEVFLEAKNIIENFDID